MMFPIRCIDNIYRKRPMVQNSQALSSKENNEYNSTNDIHYKMNGKNDSSPIKYVTSMGAYVFVYWDHTFAFTSHGGVERICMVIHFRLST
mmetsp:Transcript_18190/g.37498  ORF Transcript_18190/g.37498 Transcript_18190/m.37498 type:complete len:91 (+) Transcript_18190:142-414(+)